MELYTYTEFCNLLGEFLKQNKRIVFLLPIISMLTACGKEYETTPSGLEYKFIREGKGPKPEDGEYLMVHAIFTTQNDSVIFNSYENDMLVPVRYDTLSVALQNTTLLEEGFYMMQKGDSATFRIKAENLYERTFGASLPPNIPRGSLITCQVKAEEILTSSAYMHWQEEEIKKKQEKLGLQNKTQLESDILIIDKYLQKNNLNAQTTISGLRYIIHEAGTGTYPVQGDTVLFHYQGKLLDGTVITDSKEKDLAPRSFVMGSKQILTGWEEGITLLKKGAKASLYLPSPLAYGARGLQNVVDPNTILVIDIELIEIR
jgi:FKBP-type peptidyl-prolyl cis-trans isomerase FkpA